MDSALYLQVAVDAVRVFKADDRRSQVVTLIRPFNGKFVSSFRKRPKQVCSDCPHRPTLAILINWSTEQHLKLGRCYCGLLPYGFGLFYTRQHVSSVGHMTLVLSSVYCVGHDVWHDALTVQEHHIQQPTVQNVLFCPFYTDIFSIFKRQP